MGAFCTHLGPRPLGFWSTAGWFLLAALASLVATIIVSLGGLAFARAAGIGSPAVILGYAALILFDVLFVLIIAARVKRAGWQFVHYVALIWPRRADVLIGIASIVAVSCISAGLSYRFGIGAQDYAADLEDYRTAQAAGALPLLWLAVIAVAPLSEELAFRGFLFRGWAASGLGIWGTVVVTSLLFGAIHFQYSVSGVAEATLGGFLLGWLRLRTDGAVVPILAHALYNGIEVIALAIGSGAAS